MLNFEKDIHITFNALVYKLTHMLNSWPSSELISSVLPFFGQVFKSSNSFFPFFLISGF